MRHRRACFFIPPSGHAVAAQVPLWEAGVSVLLVPAGQWMPACAGMTMCDDVPIFLIPSQTKSPICRPRRSPGGFIIFCRHPAAGRGPLPRRDIFICTIIWIPGSGPVMTKGGGIRHYLHHDPDFGTAPQMWRKFVLGRG